MRTVVFYNRVCMDVCQRFHGDAAFSGFFFFLSRNEIYGLADHGCQTYDESNRGNTGRRMDVNVGNIHPRFHHLKSRFDLVLFKIQIDDIIGTRFFSRVVGMIRRERKIGDQSCVCQKPRILHSRQNQALSRFSKICN